MPRLMNDANDETYQIGGSGFDFTGTRVDHLTSTEYTLVSIALDETGSMWGFDKDLHAMLVAAVDACKRSPRSDNILCRVFTFSSMYPRGVNEVHGFKALADIDVAQYPALQPGGMTPLNDACFSAMGATLAYGQQLADQDYGVNAILFIITDGGENASVATTSMVREEIAKAVHDEKLESVISILVGINASRMAGELADYQRGAGMTQFIDAGDATPAKLAKLADFVSQSISSQSQSLGTGGPSKNIAATI